MTNAIFAELLHSHSQAAVCWLGNAGWLIRAGGRLLATDPDLHTSIRKAPAPIAAEEFGPVLDFVFISHEHDDHLNARTAAVLAKASRCVFVLPANCVAKARAAGVPENRIRVAQPGESFDLPGIHVQALRAIHGHWNQSVYSGANLEDCGYLLEVGGKTFLQPGDSLLTEEHLAMGPVDVLFISPTIHNMHVAPAANLIQAIRPAHVFPQHYDTYEQTEKNRFWTEGFADELQVALSPELRGRYHVVRQGEVFRLP
jgi:L-ascorbate 6-phosphate lactonase